MKLALIGALILAMGSASAHADRGRHEAERRVERPAAIEQGNLRDQRRTRDEVDERDYRRRERMSEEERRRLREDIDAASREIYRRQR